jgi:hypothetical protein
MSYNELDHDNRITTLEQESHTATFRVASANAWEIWRTKGAGYDYRSIVIDSPSSPITITQGIDLGFSGTKYIQVTAGTVINVNQIGGGGSVTEPAYVFSYPGTVSDASITGVNIVGNLVTTGNVGYWALFINCANIKNCSIALQSTQNVSLTAFQTCNGVEDTTVSVEASNSTRDQYGYYQCQNLNNCGGVAVGGLSASAFANCTALARCKGLADSTTATYTDCTSIFGNACDNTALGGWNA